MNNMPYVRQSALLILYRDDKILLQLRDEGAQRFPGYWSFFGGGVDTGETPLEAVRREAMEELEIEIEPQLLASFDIMHEDGLHKKVVYLAPLQHSINQLKKQQQEGQDLALFSLDEVGRIKFPSENLAIIKELIKHFGR